MNRQLHDDNTLFLHVTRCNNVYHIYHQCIIILIKLIFIVFFFFFRAKLNILSNGRDGARSEYKICQRIFEICKICDWNTHYATFRVISDITHGNRKKIF